MTPSTIHAPVLTRHGWADVHCWAQGGTRGPAPETCAATGTHSTWEAGFSSSYTTPPGFHATLHLSRRICDHEWRARIRRDSEPSDLLELLAVTP